MELAICSYSFHRLLKAGKQDMLRYIADCRELGCTQLDPWNGHLAPVFPREGTGPITPEQEAYLEQIEDVADQNGLPWGCLAVDGAHVYEPTEEARNTNRQRAYKWIDVAGKLGFEQIRIDAGGPEEMPDEVFRTIVAGYNDLITRAKPLGVQVIMENHFGPSLIPDNVVKLCSEIDGLGLLYDTSNWKAGLHDEGRRKCAKFAAGTHVKTFKFDASGHETSGEKPEEAIQILLDHGYKGVWGVESVPEDGDEYGGARKTIDLIRRHVS